MTTKIFVLLLTFLLCPLQAKAFFFWYSQSTIEMPVEMTTKGNAFENGYTTARYADGSTRTIHWRNDGYTVEDSSNDGYGGGGAMSASEGLAVAVLLITPLLLYLLFHYLPKITLGIIIAIPIVFGVVMAIKITKEDITKKLEENKTEKITLRMSNASEGVQIEQVRKDVKWLQYINNPSDKVQVEAIKWNINAISYIKNPCEKAQIEVLRWNQKYLHSIKNPCKKIMLLQDQKQLVEKRRQIIAEVKSNHYYGYDWEAGSRQREKVIRIEMEQNKLEIEEKKLEEMWKKITS